MSQQTETLEGYVVDIACLRSYPRSELLSKAQTHTRDCNLMGPCLESGFALVDNSGHVTVLDQAATPQVAAAMRSSRQEKGNRLRVEREQTDKGMRTRQVQEIG